jgi:hypothetical protein
MKKIILIAFVLTLTIGFNSCKKSNFAINDNPYQITESTVDYRTVLPAAQATTAAIVASNWRAVQGWMGFWARSGSYQSITDEESYNFTTSFDQSNAMWANLYGNITNYNNIQNAAAAKGAGVYEGIARIMKAHNFGLLVDIFGNIPYNDALKGVDNLIPKYSKGIDVYKDLLLQLDTAIIRLKTPATNNADKNPEIAKFDLAYAGNTANWIKVANTLKLRLIIHAADVPGFPVATEYAKIVANAGGFLGAGENLQINPGYTSAKPNPYYRQYVTNEGGTAAPGGDVTKASAYAIGPLGTNPAGAGGIYGYNGDPRAARFYVAGALGLRGIPYGEVSGANTDNIGSNLASLGGPGLVPAGAASRAWIMTSVESLFLQAEAKERNIISGGAGTASAQLTAAINESFVWLGLTATQAASYVSGNFPSADVNYGVTAGIPASGPQAGLYTIIHQKWYALNAIAPYEVWTDYRRTDITLGVSTGFPAGPPLSVIPSRTSNKIPVRMLYPQTEYNFNAANVAGEGTINQFTSKIFWDLN